MEAVYPLEAWQNYPDRDLNNNNNQSYFNNSNSNDNNNSYNLAGSRPNLTRILGSSLPLSHHDKELSNNLALQLGTLRSSSTG